MSSDDLTTLRNKIDKLDERIITLLEQRAYYSMKAAQIKQATEKTPLFYRPEREATILRNRLSSYQGILNKSDLAAIFSNIISSCRSIQQQQTIAYLEPNGMNSYAAVLKHFGTSVQSLTFSSLQEIFQAVEKEHAHVGVIPIKHSRSGVNNETLSLLKESSLLICGEINLNIGNYCLQFFVIGKQKVAPNGFDKTTLIISSENREDDMLINTMTIFKNQKITVISNEYIKNIKSNNFFIEINGHQNDKVVQLALSSLNDLPVNYHILGSYPAAI